MSVFNVIYITDENYLMPTCVSIISLKATRSKESHYHVYVLTENILVGEKNNLLSIAEDNFKIEILEYRIEEYRELAKICLAKDMYVTSSAIYKFDIAYILKKVDKVLYLDSDIIVNKDLAELFATDLSENYVAAVDEMDDRQTENSVSKLAERIGLLNQRYFNSGVMLLNLHQMRQDRIPEQLLTYRREQKNYFMDQDALNFVLGEKRISLPYCYNFRTALLDIMDIGEISDRFFDGIYIDVESCLSGQFIIHMSDRLKPWRYNFPWVTDYFLHYYKQSPYKDIPLYLLSPLKALNDRYNKEKEKLQRDNRRKVWKFPFDRVKKESDIILYGAGKAGKDLYKQVIESGYCRVVLWVDQRYRDIGETISGPERILSCQYDYIVIAITDKIAVEEVKEALIAQGIDLKKIVRI